MTLLRRLKVYPNSADPRIAACNSIALVVALNQPIYPFYLLWFVGGDAWVACITFLSTPLFLAVPWLSRRQPVAGRVLLPLAGIGNTVISSIAFGKASGVVLFVLPCAIIAALALRRSERGIMFALIGLSLLAWAALWSVHINPIGRFSVAEYQRFFRLNAYSVLTLCVFVGWSFRRTFRA